MPDAIYPAAKEKMLNGQIDWLNDPIVAVLVSTGTTSGSNAYTFSPYHASFADVPAGARVAMSGTLTVRTSTYGVADAADTVLLSVFGNVASAVLLVSYTGTDIQSPLIAYLDEGVNIPVNPDGGTITLQWSNGNSRIFAL